MVPRRVSDRQQRRRTIFGATILMFAIVLKFVQPAGADWLIIALVAVGAGLVSPAFIVDLMRSWRKSGPPPDHGA